MSDGDIDPQDIIDGGDGVTPQLRAWAAGVASNILRGGGPFSRTAADSTMALNIVDLAEWIITGRSAFDEDPPEGTHLRLLDSPGSTDETTDPDKG